MYTLNLKNFHIYISFSCLKKGFRMALCKSNNSSYKSRKNDDSVPETNSGLKTWYENKN